LLLLLLHSVIITAAAAAEEGGDYRSIYCCYQRLWQHLCACLDPISLRPLQQPCCYSLRVQQPVPREINPCTAATAASRRRLLQQQLLPVSAAECHQWPGGVSSSMQLRQEP
jgi:hypothetical protein